MSYKPPRRPQFFYTTAPLPCPYVAGRTERKVVTEITGPDADGLHDRLSRAGFRRGPRTCWPWRSSVWITSRAAWLPACNATSPCMSAVSPWRRAS